MLSAQYVWKSSKLLTGTAGLLPFLQMLNSRSLDCRHVFCGPCIASWFTTRRDNTCPECRAACPGYPQRDFALQEILQMVYEGLGREVPTYEAFDGTIFARIYAILGQYRTTFLSLEGTEQLWAPMIAETNQLVGNPVPVVQVPVRPRSVTVVDGDVDMQENAPESGWDLGSGVGSEEGNGEGGTGVARSDDETVVVHDTGVVHGAAQHGEEIDQGGN